MVFFTTPELLEIGDLPLVRGGKADSRGSSEILPESRRALRIGIAVVRGVLRVDGQDGNFTVVTETEKGIEERYTEKRSRCHRILRSAEYHGIPGEDLPHVRTITPNRTNSGIKTSS